MKVLFLGGGRRNSLAKMFKKHGYEVFAYELDIDAPICLDATIIAGKPWSNQEGVIEDILNIKNRLNIDVVLPLQDSATAIVSLLKNEINGIPTSNSYVNSICLNKELFESSFKLMNPRSSSVLPHMYPFPNPYGMVIKKPKNGCNSKGITKITYEEYAIEPFVTDFVYQQYIEDAEEYSVDCYFDKNSNLVDCIVRERLIIQGGEVAKSKTLPRNSSTYQLLSKAVYEFGDKLKPNGPMCIQFIKSKNCNDFYIMEANARFGGGVILSLEAGFDMISCITNEYVLNKPITYAPGNWKENFVMHRYFSEHFFTE